MRFRSISALVLAALLVLAGCGTAAKDSASAGTHASSEARHHEFSAETLDGASFEGTQLAGKPAVLWFWAPWCPTCRAQAAGVSRLAEQYAGQVSVVAVGGLAHVDDIREFAGQVPGPTHLIDLDGVVWRHFGVTAQSTYVVLDADGGVDVEGYLDDQVLPTR